MGQSASRRNLGAAEFRRFFQAIEPLFTLSLEKKERRMLG
jgi:hypothetical protein